MSDWQRPDGREPGDEPADLGAAPPTVSLESSSEVRNRGIGARLVAAVVGGILLLGGVGFAATQLGGDERTPEEAVGEFFEAISDEDVLGVLATLDPGERDALAGPVQDLFDELERLEILDDAFDPNGVSGVDLEFEDLAFHSEAVHDDLVRVYLVGGRATFDFDSDEVAIGDFVTDTFARFDVDHTGVRESDTATFDGTLDEFLAVRHGAEGWRVSLGYTAAEAARIESGLPLPDPAEALSPIGADSPEAAVEGAVRALAGFDVAGIVARLSPAEVGALQEYWPLIADGAEMVDAAGFGVAVEIRSLDLRSEADGDRARVYVDGFDVGIAADGMVLDLTLADGCITYSGDLEQLGMGGAVDGPVCADDIGALFEDSFGTAGLDESMLELPTFDPIRTPESFVVAHRVDGRWYLAPISSGAEAVVEGLRTIDRSHLDALVDMAEQFVGMFTGATTMTEYGSSSALVEPDMDLPDIAPGQMDPHGSDDGRPRPGVSSEHPAPETWNRITEGVMSLSGDEEATACVLVQLQTTATTPQLYELHDGLVYGISPSEPTVHMFEGILGSCGVRRG